jgi:phage terminase large subunit GpA-like protein
MKSGQTAWTKGVILPGIVWMVENNPAPTKLLVGHNDLIKAAGKDLDAFIDGSGIRHRIESSSQRARKTQTGDTNTLKEFAGGWIGLGLTNPDSLRQISLQNLIVDDFDAMDSETKKDGDIDTVFKQRMNAYANTYLLWKISTPTRKGKSNIERDYLKGDQRKWHIPAPCCNEFIVLEWSPDMLGDKEGKGGIVWEVDDHGNLVPESVGYKCQSCGEVFDDREKMSWLNAGRWIPTAISTRPELRSYHFNALSSPTFMYGWVHYVYQWLDYLNSPKEKQQTKLQSFTNLVLGEPFKFSRRSTSASKLQDNIRKYDVGTIPEKLSIQDGNGPIVLVVCAMDLGGTMEGLNKGERDDVRIDWQIKAYAAGGQSYSIDQGSFGTFIPRDKNPELREDTMKTYAFGVENSVWLDVEKLISTKYENDRTGKMIPIHMTGIDAGHFTDYVYTFVDANIRCVALKGGDDEETKVREISDFKTFQPQKRRKNGFIVRTNFTKDIIASHMDLVWNREVNSQQPFGFMNFPIPRDGKYLKSTFFDQYESEERSEEKGKYAWHKKQSNSQNHFWDVEVYTEVVKDIFVDQLFKKIKKPNGTWDDYVAIFKALDKKSPK